MQDQILHGDILVLFIVNELGRSQLFVHCVELSTGPFLVVSDTISPFDLLLNDGTPICR